jgi:hypothetical protein
MTAFDSYAIQATVVIFAFFSIVVVPYFSWTVGRMVEERVEPRFDLLVLVLMWGGAGMASAVMCHLMAGLLPVGGENLIGHPGYILGLAATMLAPVCLLGGRVAERVQMELQEAQVLALWGLALANIVIWSLLQMEGSYWM